jgi:2'-5' RNA ligase
MRKVDIRVRPVVRHVVTWYESGPMSGTTDKYHATLDTLGEFDNEAQAERVAEALRASTPKPMQYVAVERNHWDTLAHAMYFDVEADAYAYVKHAESKGREFRVFAREVTDPLQRAHHEMGMVSHGFPGGIDQVEMPPALPQPPELVCQQTIT